MADFYFNGFPEKWQTQINTVLVATYSGDAERVGVRTIDDITTAANNIFGDRTYAGKRGHDEHSSGRYHSHSRFDKKRKQYEDTKKDDKKFIALNMVEIITVMMKRTAIRRRKKVLHITTNHL